jgi:hypothetical protein
VAAIVGRWPSSFASPGPRVPISGEITEAIAFKQDDHPIVGVAIVGSSVESARLLAVKKDGQVFECRCNSSIHEIPTTRIPTSFISFQDDTIVYRSRSSISIGLVKIETGIAVESPSVPHFSPITALTANRELILTGGAYGSVAIWHSPDSGPIRPSRPVDALAVSDHYGVAVSCSQDGAMVTASLPDFVFLRLIEVGFAPQTVAVT